MDKTEMIIAALKYCAKRTDERTTCDGCPYADMGKRENGAVCPILNDAAAELGRLEVYDVE